MVRPVTRYWAALLATFCVAFGVVWLWVALAPLAFLDPEYPAWRAKQRMLAGCDLGELLVVGDSRAAVDVIPAALPLRSTNLAVGGGSPIEAYAVVSRALTCSSVPRRVVVSFDAAHFTEPDLFWERSVRFGFIAPEDLRDLHLVSRQLNDRTVLDLRNDGLPPFLRSELYMLRFPSFYFGSLTKGGVFLRWWHNQQSLVDVTASRGQYFFGTDPGSSVVAVEGYIQSFRPLPVLDRYFDRMLSLLAQREVAVDFVAMPINDATNKAVRLDVRQAFKAYLVSYAARYPNFRVIGEVMPHWPDLWFGDNFSHLNPAGAQRFSALLAKWLSATADRSTEHADLVVQ